MIFYIYSFDELEFVRAYLFGATKQGLNKSNGRRDSFEIQAELGEIDSSNPKIARLRFEIDIEAAIRSGAAFYGEYSFVINPVTKSYLSNQASLSSGNKAVYYIDSERADMLPPEVVSGSFSN